jgi:glyoxylase-like metal-dependent hydrolase (beta-lactamase superfamily II)
LQPDGGWGWSKTGLVAGTGESLLVDTCFDLDLTGEMLAAYGPLLAGAPLSTVFNTHANADPVGNQLVPDGVRIIATAAAGEEMNQTDLERLEGLKRAPGATGEYAREIFGPFDFTPVVATPPTETFGGETRLEVGGREVLLYELGPAHTPGDAVAWVPDFQVAYVGDILFIGGTPIIRAGPVENWIRACDRLLELPARAYVPGHGPITDRAGVIKARDYLVFVREAASSRFAMGMTIQEATADIDKHLGEFAALGARERLAQNVANIYGFLDPDADPLPISEVFQAIAALDGYPAAAESREGSS